MSDAVDRMWDIRDALLLWLYEQAAAGRTSPHVDIQELQTATGWAAEPITENDIASATTYLKSEGYITGTSAWGAGVIRPAITSAGENQAATGLSVRPGTEKNANVTGVTHTYNITTNGPTNLAVNSNDFAQNLTFNQITDKVIAVADALDEYGSATQANADKARGVAAELRSSAENPEGNKHHLLSLLNSAIATVAVAAGSELGQQVTQLAVGAIQSLG